jgi:hypothetical protein
MDYAIYSILVGLVIAALVENYVRVNYSVSHAPG